MRRALLAFALILAAAAPAAGASMPTPPPRNSLEGFVCERQADALDRVVAVTAVMRPMSGTQRMEMRFVLERRALGTDSFSPVQGGDLGHWLTPNPATLGQQPSDVWKLRKLVANLTGPASYRFRVSFRWTGNSAVVLNRTSLLSDACAEPR